MFSLRSSTKPHRRRRVLSGALLLALAAPPAAPRAAVLDSPVYTLEVDNISAKVGEPAVMTARIRLHDGFRILQGYKHHVSQLSAYDDGVAFQKKWVDAKDEDGTLVFAIDVRPVKPGDHPINGFVRFGYIAGSEGFSMVSVPLMAKVTGVN